MPFCLGLPRDKTPVTLCVSQGSVNITPMSIPLLPYQERIHAAIAHKKVLAIRGLGSKDFLGHPPPPDAEVLDTTALNGIISHEPTELVITAYAGTPVREIEQALAQHGQWLPAWRVRPGCRWAACATMCWAWPCSMVWVSICVLGARS
jgi:hypothetical protein